MNAGVFIDCCDCCRSKKWLVALLISANEHFLKTKQTDTKKYTQIVHLLPKLVF